MASRSTAGSCAPSSGGRRYRRSSVAVAVRACAATGPVEGKDPMEQSFATPHPVLVYVHNDVGSTVITAHSEDTSHVSLTAETPGARELVERATVECRQRGGRDVVVVNVPRVHGMKFIRRNGVTVRVDVPQGSDVRVVSASADVELNGSLGRANVK